MRAADERHDVVLAMGGEGDVAHEHDVAIALDLLEDAVEKGGGILAVTREKLLESARHPPRRLGEPLAAGIVAGPADQRANRRLGFLTGRRPLGGARRIRLMERRALDGSVQSSLRMRGVA
jgi:hypothetical protein